MDGDSVVMFNFRPDRAREITRCFVDSSFNGFERKKTISDLFYVTMTQYDATMPNVHIAFPPESIKNTLGEYAASLGLKQLRIAETEKYAHVTFFFNGGVEKPNEGEDRILVPSPKVATYDLQPEMSAYIITEKVIEQIRADKYDLIILNFANADMVGHTGIMEAAIKAIETLDVCVPKIANEIMAKGGQMLLTADHGNADIMMDKDGKPVTKHSTNPVPLVNISNDPAPLKSGGKLADLAPTLLDMMGIDIPEEMTGESLIEK
jgi:2,3-bisphosphoglycerate-independent phosphoglycerate mutase